MRMIARAPGQPAVLIGNAVEVAHFAKLMRLLGIPGQVAEQVGSGVTPFTIRNSLTSAIIAPPVR
jgi:hypothetical protein